MCVKEGCGRSDIKARGMCVTHYNRWWYNKNKDKHIGDVSRNRERYVRALRSVYDEWRSQGCSQCGYKEHVTAIDAHHVDDNKVMDVGRIVHGNYGMDMLVRELDKCVPVCANCHRVIHCLGAELDTAAVS